MTDDGAAKGGYIDPAWTAELVRYLNEQGCTYRYVTVAQHTYTPACDGLHEPGPCPTMGGGRS